MVKVRKNLVGQKFGRLTVIKQTEDYVRPDGRHEAKWLCECDCEEKNNVEVVSSHLKSQHTQSCGCLQREAMVENGLNTKNLIPNEKKPNNWDLESYDYGVGYTSKGEEFWFDKEDFDKINKYTWYINDDGYVICTDNKIYLHILIMNPYDGQLVDHKKHRKFDNRKSELRIVNATQNAINRCMQSNNTSGTTGVSFHKASKKWFAYIKINKKQKRKYANSKEEAIIFRKELEEKYFGEYSYDNSIKENYL